MLNPNYCGSYATYHANMAKRQVHVQPCNNRTKQIKY